jgi:outer membrane PBP1 activator LpoA protein
MITKLNHIKVLTILILFLILSSCSLFRKKNRCSDCPKWSKAEYHFYGIEQNI